MAVTTSGKDKLLRHARLYVGGYDLSCDARTVSSLDLRYEEADLTGWCELVRNYIPGSPLLTGIRGFQGLMNDTAGRSYAVLKDADNLSQVSFLFGGGGAPAVGDPAYLMPSVQLGDLAGWDSMAATISADFLPDSNQVAANTKKPLGVVLQNATGLTATTTNGSHDNEAGTTNGWQANLHVTATSSGDYAFVIEDSTNDSDWTTLGTFTADGSAVTSEYLTGSGAVDRYVRVVSTRTAGTVTAIITFARG